MKKNIVLLAMTLPTILGCVTMLGATWHVRVIGGPQKGNVAIILGSSKDVWDIDDVWKNPKSLSIHAISNYLISNPPMYGIVYYGKIQTSCGISLGYCFHESWLEIID